MQARHCPACDRELVQRPGEKTWQYQTRTTCGRECFRVLMRLVSQKKWDLREQEGKAEIEQRTAEVRAQIRAKMTEDGCRWTDSLD